MFKVFKDYAQENKNLENEIKSCCDDINKSFDEILDNHNSILDSLHDYQQVLDREHDELIKLLS